MSAKPRVGWIRVVPGPGGQLDDPGTHRVVHGKPGQACAPVVEDPHEVTVVQPAYLRVGRVHPRRLTPGDLDRLAVRADIQLAV